MKTIIASAVALFLLLVGPHFVDATDDVRTVKVFLLAGQSNMEGQGVVDLDHPEYYNGGKGILQNVAKDDPDRYAHLFDKNGKWSERDDVFVRFVTRHETKSGPLTIGFTGYEGRHHIGPELQIGHRLGDHFEQPVLLIKTAWGGKSLHKDFRPPSADGEPGEFYQKMLAEYNQSLANIEKDFPQLKGLKPELCGFIWFQGWNDMFDEKARDQYEDNLVCLIQDIRNEFGNSQLPVVVGELGNGGDDASASMLALRQAQKRAVERDEVKNHCVFVKTTPFARPKEQSPNVGHGHHWFGNAESYFLIGDALGKAMVELQK